jgi:dGTP triphosphohydrolase
MIEFTENQKDKIDVALDLIKDDNSVISLFGRKMIQNTISEIVIENMDKELLEQQSKEVIQELTGSYFDRVKSKLDNLNNEEFLKLR